MTRVLFIDDHPVIMQGCRRILEDAGADQVIEATNDTDGYRFFREHKPEVVIVDLSLQGSLGLSGLDLIRRLRKADRRVPILVLSMHCDPVIVSRAMEAGATGYVSKEGAPENLVDAFEKVRRGETYLSHDLAVEVAVLGTRAGGGRFGELTPRELRALALVAEGKSYEEIARNLGVSYKTVVNICSQLRAKLGAESLSDLIRKAIKYLS
jgi:two-component system, NarL family, invasion response regulator UvrY